MRARSIVLIAAFVAAVAPGQLASAQGEVGNPSDARAVQAHVDAYRSGSLDRFVASFAPDAQVVMHGVTVASGHDDIRALYQSDFYAGMPKLKITDSGYKAKRVYLSTAMVYPNGAEVCCGYSEFVVRGGKIARAEHGY